MLRAFIALGLLLTGIPAVVPAGTTGCDAQPTRVSVPMQRHSGVDAFVVSPDGRWVVFHADAERDGRIELYSAPLYGGPAVRLNPPFDDGEVFRPVDFTPDSARVVFTLDEYGDGHGAKLYSVPIGGGPATMLNPPLTNQGGVTTWSSAIQITPDGTTVLFISRHGAYPKEDLYRVPVDGGEVVRVNHAGSAGLVFFGMNQTGDLVYYSTSTSVSTPDTLYIAPTMGGEFVELATARWGIFTSDGDYIVYPTHTAGSGPSQIWSTRLADLARFRISRPSAVGGSISVPIEVAPDDSRVVHGGDLETLGQTELYSSGLEGAPRVKLNDPLPPQGDVEQEWEGAAISAESSTVVYLADNYVDSIEELLSVPIEGGPVTNLSDLGSYGSVLEFALDGNSSRAVYRLFRQPGLVEIESVPIAGGATTTLNPPLAADSDVWWFTVSRDGGHVAYIADQETDGVYDLYSVGIAGGLSTKLSPPLGAGRRVYWESSTSWGNRDAIATNSMVVYRADERYQTTWELYRALLPDADSDGDTQPNCTDPCPLDAADDADADGFCADADCAPADVDLWALPGSVDLRLGRSGNPPDTTVLTWTANAGGTAPPSYDTLRSADPTDFGEMSANCVETDDATDAQATDPDVPGELFFYLVVPENDCGRAPGGTVDVFTRRPRDCS